MVTILYHIKSFFGRFYNLEYMNQMDRLLVKLIAVYYVLFPRKGSGIRGHGDRSRRKVIVSLTTIPDRIGKVWITIESLLRQTYQPDEIVLWLAEDEFSDRELPEKVRGQMKRGLTVRYCENLKSYKKFYHTMRENPGAYVITADDDIVYAETMVRTLLRTYWENPRNIICSRSHFIKKRGMGCAPYDSWAKYEERGKAGYGASHANFFTSGAGVLFPVFLLDKRVLSKEIFMRLAPTADDVWLNFICWISGIKVKNAEGVLGNLIYINDFSGNGLALENVVRRKNDSQIRAVLDYFKIDVNDYI